MPTRYFLYRMTGDESAPPWGTRKAWFYYYKWGRPEIVTLPLPIRLKLRGIRPRDILFIVMDNVILGHAMVLAVREDHTANGEVQELDINGDGIWDHGDKKIRLRKGSRRVPEAQGAAWVARSISTGHTAVSSV